MPAQLVNEHVESQAKHVFDPEDLACILSGETKSNEKSVQTASLADVKKQQKNVFQGLDCTVSEQKENT